MNKEIVVSLYDKELYWLSNFNKDVKQTIYRKGDIVSNDNEILLENNVGRDVHTFFHHIASEYNNLSDITFFAQDYPFDHWEDVVEVINNNTWVERSALRIGGYYGFHFNSISVPGPKGGIMWRMTPTTQHGDGNILTCNSNGTPQAALGTYKINMDEYWGKFFEGSPPSSYEFIPGGHFGVTKEQTHLRSLDFYKSVVKILKDDIHSPWIIERLECYMFNPKYKTKL